ncbi:bifunctional diaminohydroxyphosphoribosylaminopyrimidine deaminase/5-amino-6-(5-phosphoribosylamino)uracil reductase RibD [Opitutus sp. ER46]|uniref:bifunctional diaminohydroxyphosphoribosylaminopyrimidine deaminase/5-amino-6-(5-phosphoribosylamino)uracil reductase RibD n=1 Tax=Opitutus sp. ER46 TaxID=2161864 RepID=UPI000D3221D8|nr:bifunctional diaminohydroxyphosphoribosylaminopyrimidine deaminase/5-amino-6-(5-phosphoribosylamino)uracil reductase RibD [Opitutus sp. ER46]PTX99110.1 bifunctional diaminohydroxyphosphoribosylaminopyrimidine deaminase/5-amino-6-(5-phosphoribosylamino)uracil reductase RibD [Opitutus sp. ER46]
MTTPEQHEGFMRRALAMARSVWGNTHPNPMVGAVIVEDGQVVAEGATAPDGGPHAERLALLARGKQPRPGATMYVTLEPCSTHGRTGACTDAIIASGIKQVVVGAKDPNPAHAGRGFDVLRAAGIEVITGVLERECTDLNLIFNHWITQDGPLLAAKAGTTLDGKIACRTGESKWITNEASRADVHRWRRLFPGIAVGAMTLLKDDPRLTARRPGEPEWCPKRFVFDGLLRTVLDKNLPTAFTDEFHANTIVVTTPHGGLGYVRKLRDMGITVWTFDSPTQRVPFADFRKKCAEERIPGVLFEGGGQLISELVRARQLDYLFVYHAPMLFADDKAKSIFSGLRPEKPEHAVRMVDVQHEHFDGDLLMRGRVQYPEKLIIDETVFSIR